MRRFKETIAQNYTHAVTYNHLFQLIVRSFWIIFSLGMAWFGWEMGRQGIVNLYFDLTHRDVSTVAKVVEVGYAKSIAIADILYRTSDNEQYLSAHCFAPLSTWAFTDVYDRTVDVRYDISHPEIAVCRSRSDLSIFFGLVGIGGVVIGIMGTYTLLFAAQSARYKVLLGVKDIPKSKKQV